MQDASGTFGVKVEEPFWCEVKHSLGQERDGKGYITHLSGFPFNQYKIAVVIIHDPKHKKLLKGHLDSKGIVSQFILASTINRAKITVYSNILKQINAKL